MLELYNQQHRSVSVVRALLEEHIDPERVGEEGLPAMTPIKVLKMVGIDRPSNTQCKECGAILRDWLGEPKRIKGEWKYRVPVRAADAFTSVKLRHDDDRY
jgi:putative DNA primase/helicase